MLTMCKEMVLTDSVWDKSILSALKTDNKALIKDQKCFVKSCDVLLMII